MAELDDAASLNALQELRSRSLVEELDRSKRRYKLHALVREASGATELFRQIHAEFVQEEFDNWETAWHQCEEDMADWRVVFNWSLAQPTDDDAWFLARTLAYLGFSLTYRLGRLPEAHDICVLMVREADDRQDWDTLQSWYGSQAPILEAWGQLDDAMILYEKQEAICLELDNQYALQGNYANKAFILRFGDVWTTPWLSLKSKKTFA